MKTRQAFAVFYCSKELTQDLYNQIICPSVINTPLAISAIVGNALILIALRKKKNNTTSSFKSVDAEPSGQWSRCGPCRTFFCCLLGVHSARPDKQKVNLLVTTLQFFKPRWSPDFFRLLYAIAYIAFITAMIIAYLISNPQFNIYETFDISLHIHSSRAH